MTLRQAQCEGARLKKIRAQLAGIGEAEWLLSSDGSEGDSGMFIESKARNGELVPILRFGRLATPDEMQFVAAAPESIRFLLKLVDRAIAAVRNPAEGREPDRASRPAGAGASKASGAPREAKDFAAEAAMKCQEPGFRVFLAEKHGLERPLTEARAAQKLRSLLGVTTRAALNRDQAAAERWKHIRREFEAWRRAG